jgi:hypothetical protein
MNKITKNLVNTVVFTAEYEEEMQIVLLINYIFVVF